VRVVWSSVESKARSQQGASLAFATRRVSGLLLSSLISCYHHPKSTFAINMPSTTSKLKGQPSRWPSNVTYTVHPCYHSSVTPDIRKHIQGEAPERSDSNLASSRPLVLIKQISDSAHPACGQYGLFTAKKIPARTRMCEVIQDALFCT
jgi:hypothetical protein